MSEATWGNAASPAIDWRMSAALRDVPRGDNELAEVTSLEGAVRAWLELDEEHRAVATLTPEHPLVIDGASVAELHGHGIEQLAARLPEAAGGEIAADDDDYDEAG